MKSVSIKFMNHNDDDCARNFYTMFIAYIVFLGSHQFLLFFFAFNSTLTCVDAYLHATECKTND